MFSYFHNKTCDICKGRAVKYRYIGKKGYMICDSKKCDSITLVKAGWMQENEIDSEQK